MLFVRGRTSLQKYVVFMSISILLTLLSLFLFPQSDQSFVLLLVSLPIYWIVAPFIITIRRFHDVGLSEKSVWVTTFILIILWIVICFCLFVLVAAASVGGRTTFPMWFLPLFWGSIIAFIVVLGRNMVICLRPGQKNANAYGKPTR